MAVALASMADKIIILDDDDGDASPSYTTSSGSKQQNAKQVSPLKSPEPAPTHITTSPFASAKKESHVLQVENEKLFTEFVDHCTPLTKDCPEVITFLKTKHAKASPSFLSSVEFRNTLGRCLTRAQTHHSKTFVYINELCTVLRQHGVKKRLNLTKTDSASSQLAFDPQNAKDKAEGGESGKLDDQSSTSGLKEDGEIDKKAERKSRKQIAYLENLLKVYNDEIRRLQEADLGLDELGAEDSSYIQEHKLKRKMMKIYEKLCEIKGCSTLTGRVLEQRISYSGSRYPEINKRIERFINSPEARTNPPDYQDILQQVLRANERSNLCLTRKQLNEIAKEAFRETASRIQDRRHLDLVYNFGSHLTDTYKPAADPALMDPSLMRKLRSNRELALNRLEDVITKYAGKQEDTEEQERLKRAENNKSNKEGNTSKRAREAETNGVHEDESDQGEEEEEEEEEDEDDESSDPDIDEEIQASTQQDEPEGASEEEEENNEAERAGEAADEDQPASVSVSEKDEEDVSDLSPMSQQSKSLLTPVSSSSSPRDSPCQSEPSSEQRPLSNGAVESACQVSAEVVNGKPAAGGAAGGGEENGVAPSPSDSSEKCDTQTSNGTSPPHALRTTRALKRKREEAASAQHTITRESDADIPLDMEVFNCDSPPRAQSTRAETPPHNVVSSSQSTPPPKKNKVNVATQCDPQEVIVLSDSE